MPRLNADMINDHAAEVMRRAFGLDRDSRPAPSAELIDSLSSVDDSATEAWSTIRAPDDWRGFPVASTLEQAESAINFRAKCRRMGLPASVLLTLDREWEFVGQVENSSHAGRVDTLCQTCRQNSGVARDGDRFSTIVGMNMFNLCTDSHHCYVWHGVCSECNTPHWCHSPIMENE